MSAKTRDLIAAAILPLLIGAPVSAHHSFAMFDVTKEVTVQGVVKQFTWANPHVWLDIVVNGDNGQAQTWGLESLAVGLLYRQGWTADSIKPGDKVTVVVHPMRDGTFGGQLMRVTLADGHVLNSTNARQ
jgi:hypothetical protein